MNACYYAYDILNTCILWVHFPWTQTKSSATKRSRNVDFSLGMNGSLDLQSSLFRHKVYLVVLGTLEAPCAGYTIHCSPRSRSRCGNCRTCKWACWINQRKGRSERSTQKSNIQVVKYSQNPHFVPKEICKYWNINFIVSVKEHEIGRA
jgi:hypothetical protein